MMYQYGWGTPQDDKEAVKWYHKAAENGDPFAQFELSLRYEYGWGVSRNNEDAIKWHNKASFHFSTFAGYKRFGWLPRSYEEVAQEIEGTIEWYRAAVKRNYPTAQFRLAKLYEYGWGVPQDDEKAVRWYHTAAKHGDADALFELALRHDHGSRKWHGKSTQQDYTSAQYRLGMKYSFGTGVTQSHSEAVKWYRKAAEQDHVGAQYALGWAYYKGEGVHQDYGEAFKWYQKAAEQGDSGSQYRLGVMYENGEGVAQDYVASYIWYHLASQAHEFESARKHRNRVAEKMTPAQLAEAQRLAGEWKPKKMDD